MRSQLPLVSHTPRRSMLAFAVAAVALHGVARPVLADVPVPVAPTTEAGATGSDRRAAAAGFTELLLSNARGAAAESNAHRGQATADATARTYVGAAGTGLFSSAGNWSPTGTPVAGDSLTFGSTPTVAYAVTNDLPASTVLGDLLVNRDNATPVRTTTLNGGFNGNRIEVTTGGLVVNGGSTTLSSEIGTGTDPTLFSARVGVNAGNIGSLTINNGAQFSYRDLVHGSTGGTGNVVISGTGTVLSTPQGQDIASYFRGGGGGTSNVLIDDHAQLTTNEFYSNYYDTTTISNGATLVALDYYYNSLNPDTGTITNRHFGGEVIVGEFAYTSALPAPLSTLNVTSGGSVTADYTYFASTVPGQRGNGLIDGGTVTTGLFKLASPALLQPGATAPSIGTPTDFSLSTVTISGGGVVNTQQVIAGSANTSRATLKVMGANSTLNVAQGAIYMGGFTLDPKDILGAGSTDLIVSDGGSVIARQLVLGNVSAASHAADYSGNNVNVSGPGSKVTLTGSPAIGESSPGAGDAVAAVSASMYVGFATQRTSTVTVSGGGQLSLLNNALDSNQNGAMFVGYGANTVSTINVDGAGSVLNAGTALEVIIGTGRNGFSAAQATINVQNGGTLFVADDGSDTGGIMYLGSTVSVNAGITMNIGGGTTTDDVNSLVNCEGIIYVGGTGLATAPTKGVATTVNMNNGALIGSVVAVYQGSTVKLNKGEVAGSLLSARGGSIKMSSTAPAGTGVLYANQFEAVANGSFDIGNQGGVSVLFDANDTDLTEIKTLINAGLAGGTNSIRSDLVTAGGNLAIGYYLRPANSTRMSFLGQSLDSTHAYVLFRLTLTGDSDLSGNVNFDDLIPLAQNYNGTGKEWYQGDFTHDGIVNFDDLIPLAQNYNAARPGGLALAAQFGQQFAADWAFAQSLVPEPTTLTASAWRGSSRSAGVDPADRDGRTPA